MTSGTQPAGGEAREGDYAANYIYQALYQDGDLPEPSEEQAGRDYHRLKGLWEASQMHGQWSWWENTKPLAPELAVKVGTAPVSLTESHRFVGYEYAWQCYEQDEVGDAELFRRLFNGRVVFDHAAGAWYFWTGNHWTQDRTQQIRGLISGQLPDQYYRAIGALAKLIQAASEDDERNALKEQQKLFGKRAKSLYTIRRIQNVLKHVETKMGITGEEWDKDPWKLSVENGTLNLRTGKLSPGDPADYIRRAAPVRYEGLNVAAPRWEQFIDEIFEDNPDIAPFMQRLLGYGITGLTTEHVFPIFYGEEGRNGKDTMLETLGDVLGGGIAGPGAPDVIIEAGRNSSGGATPHLVDLQGARLRWFSETSENARLNTNQVKYTTGGGHIKARGLHQGYIEFAATHLMILITNHKPRIPSGGDQALWERLLLIPFNMRFVESPKRDNERKRDSLLKQKLADEGAGILAWLVRGCLEWQQNGLNPPDEVKTATKHYQEDEDDILRFIDEECVISEDAKAEAGALFDLFKAWGGTRSQAKFGREIGKRGYDKRRGGNGRYVYVGIGIMSDKDEDSSE